MASRKKQAPGSNDRSGREDSQPDQAAGVTDSFTLELTLEELAFLRLLLTNATVQPAELKKLCGEVQGKVETHIGPLPGPQ